MFQIFRKEGFQKFLFWSIIAAVFGIILLYNIFTPYLSDDLVYKLEALRAGSIADLLAQQYREYLFHNGRFITQFFIRLTLSADKAIFNLANSLMFVFLILLIYENVRMPLREKRKKSKYHIGLLLLIIGMIWRYAVEFGQTILWVSGACNYLWGIVIILGFIAFYRRNLASADSGHGIRKAVFCLLFGIAVGWCSENTSGGAFILVLFFTVLTCRARRKAGQKVVLPFMITAHLGVAVGITGLLLSPGIYVRAAAMTDNYTGILAYLSRFYKCSLTIERLFFELLCIFIVLTVWAVVGQKRIFFVIKSSLPFFVAALATSYALIVIPPPTDRAHFGAGIFLLIACVQGFVGIFYGTEKEPQRASSYLAVRYTAISLLVLWFFFTYVANLVNLARIYREENERVSLLREAAAAGETSVIVPQYRPAFRNRYSTAHDNDMTEDPGYWINTFYRDYYQVEEVIAIPREEWNERFGGEDRE